MRLRTDTLPLSLLSIAVAYLFVGRLLDHITAFTHNFC